MENKNKKLLDSFVKYCHAHPAERFWQALRNWTGCAFIFIGDGDEFDRQGLVDTFYFENTND